MPSARITPWKGKHRAGIWSRYRTPLQLRLLQKRFALLLAVVQRAMAEESPPHWFSVKYGEGETALFNANCWSVVLLDYMKERCKYETLEEPVDLQREDGSPVNLIELGKTMATEALQPRGTYILCKVNTSEEGVTSLESLWTPPEGQEVPVPAAAAGKKK